MTENRQAILLAVGGGIAAYKSAIVCSRLVQDGFDVRTAMTRSATEFLGTATLAALSGKPVATDTFDSAHPLSSHIELSDGLDLIIVAPATANLVAKFAAGVADDLLSTVYLQASCPVLIAPAMSLAMWDKPSVQRNIRQLESDGCHVVGPDVGWLSCRLQGAGRMSEPEKIIQAAKDLIS